MSSTLLPLIITIVIAIFTSITAPILLAYRTEKMHREDRQADYARQDQLDKRTDKKLNVIHKLVNSNLTQAMENEHSAMKHELEMMQEVIRIRRESGTEPTPGQLESVAVTEAKLETLRANLAVRYEPQPGSDVWQEDPPGDTWDGSPDEGPVTQ